MADTQGVLFGQEGGEELDFDLPHCPVCWEQTTTESNPVQCRNGHIICVPCSVGLRKCHTCGVMMDPSNPIVCVIARHFVQYVQERKRKPNSSTRNQSDDKFQTLHRREISDINVAHADLCRLHQRALQQVINYVRRNEEIIYKFILLVMISLIIFHDARVYLDTQRKHQIQNDFDNWMSEQMKMPVGSVMNLPIQAYDAMGTGIYDGKSEESDVCQLMDDVINDKMDIFRHQIHDSFQQELNRGLVDIQTSKMVTSTLSHSIKFLATGTYKLICMLLHVIRMGLGALFYSIKCTTTGADKLLGMLLRATRMGLGSIVRFVRGPLVNAACTLVHALWNMMCRLAIEVIFPIAYSSAKITYAIVSEILRVLICMSDVVVSRYIMG